MLFKFVISILYRQLQHPLTGGERAEYDSMLLTALQVMSGIVLTRIDDIDQSLQSKDPEKFEMLASSVIPTVLAICYIIVMTIQGVQSESASNTRQIG